MEDKNKTEEVQKIIPSKLETGFQQFLYKTIGKNIPKNMTPNQITAIGALCGLVGIICTLFTRISPLFLIGTIFGLVAHLVCDDLDGYVARTRNMSSKAGGFFDLLTDILYITYLVIALIFANLVSFQIAIFLVPVYALLMFTSMNYIIYFKEFVFPKIGPIETHISFVALCIGSMIFDAKPLLEVLGFDFKFGDIVFIIGGVPIYFEMIRLQIQLFKRLKSTEKKLEK